MIVTVAEDLSVTTAVQDDGSWLRLGAHNPDTTEPWRSVEQIEQYVEAVVGRPGFWSPASEPIDPEPELAPLVPTLVASGGFTVTGVWPDTYIDGVVAAAGIAMVFPIGPGQYWAIFNEPQPDLSYAVYTSASGGQINVTERTLDYIELCVKDGGVPFDPSEFSVNIVRSL